MSYSSQSGRDWSRYLADFLGEVPESQVGLRQFIRSLRGEISRGLPAGIGTPGPKEITPETTDAAVGLLYVLRGLRSIETDDFELSWLTGFYISALPDLLRALGADAVWKDEISDDPLDTETLRNKIGDDVIKGLLEKLQFLRPSAKALSRKKVKVGKPSRQPVFQVALERGFALIKGLPKRFQFPLLWLKLLSRQLLEESRRVSVFGLWGELGWPFVYRDPQLYKSTSDLYASICKKYGQRDLDQPGSSND